MRSKWFSWCLGVLVVMPGLVQAGWWIDSFHTGFNVRPDGLLVVTETITANFTDEPHRGIYRDIPLLVQDSMGLDHRFRMDVLYVDDGEGHAQPYRVTRSRDRIRIKVGDPAVTYNDARNYRIAYQVQGWCLEFPDRQELYWNAVGTGWGVPIREASTTVELPPAIDPEKVKTHTYTGVLGSRGTDAVSGFEEGKWQFRMTRPLNPREGMTVAVAWPAGSVPVPSFKQRVLWAIADNRIFLLPILVFAGMFGLWWRKGRDPKGRESIVVKYHPPEGISAIQAGVLIDEKVDARDISAAIVDLAVKGYLTIRETKKDSLFGEKYDYELIKVQDASVNSLSRAEQFLMQQLFEKGSTTRLDDLRYKFYTDLNQFRELVYDDLTASKYFISDPSDLRLKWGIVAGLVLFVGIGACIFLTGGNPGIHHIISVILTSLIIVLFGRHLPTKTVKGVEARESLRGLEEYIGRAETNTLKLAERQNVFEEILPYAMAMGMSDKWARVFEGVFREAPRWYVGHNMGSFHASAFENRLSRACGDIGNGLSSTPRSEGGGWSGGGSGGGGSSGGGGGGGGGGAW